MFFFKRGISITPCVNSISDWWYLHKGTFILDNWIYHDLNMEIWKYGKVQEGLAVSVTLSIPSDSYQSESNDSVNVSVFSFSYK